MQGRSDDALALRELSSGLATVAREHTGEAGAELSRKARYAEALCTQVKSVQAELHDEIGRGRLPDSIADLKCSECGESEA